MINKDTTTIILAGEEAAIRAAVRSAQRLKKRPRLRDRAPRRSGQSKLAGGVAVIKAGAATEVEMKEKKARVEDALHA